MVDLVGTCGALPPHTSARVFTRLPFDVMKCFKNLFHMFAFCHSDQSFDVFKNEYLWPMNCDVVEHIVEDGAPAFGVFKSLLFSCRTEWLARKASNVDVNILRSGVVSFLDVGVVRRRLKICFHRFDDIWAIVTTEDMTEFNLEISEGLNGCFNSRTIGTNFNATRTCVLLRCRQRSRGLFFCGNEELRCVSSIVFLPLHDFAMQFVGFDPSRRLREAQFLRILWNHQSFVVLDLIFLLNYI